MGLKNIVRRQNLELFQMLVDDRNDVMQSDFCLSNRVLSDIDLNQIFLLEDKDRRVWLRYLYILLIYLVDDCQCFFILMIILVDVHLSELHRLRDILDRILLLYHFLYLIQLLLLISQ